MKGPRFLFPLVAATSLASLAAAAKQPHLILVVGDDVGWNNVGWHGNSEVQTPTMDRLAREGAILNRMYAYCWCSPSRASIMSGRFPFHVFQSQSAASSPDSGLPLGMTTLADKLQGVGYHTVQAGKWDLGLGRYSYLPVGRGFDSSLGYLTGGEDHWSQHLCQDGVSPCLLHAHSFPTAFHSILTASQIVLLSALCSLLSALCPLLCRARPAVSL